MAQPQEIPDLAREYRCLAYNRRGHAKTELTNYGFSLVNQTRDLAELIDRLHIERPVIIAVAFGTTRVVPANTPMVTFESGQYSVPHRLLGQTVWARTHGVGADEQVVIVHVGDDGPVEVARHHRATPGTPEIDDAHFPPAPEGPLERTPVPANAAEAEFLAIGDGAVLWLKEAGATGAARVRAKMADAVALAKLHGRETVNWALGHAALYGRLAEADLASIIAHRAAAGADGAPQRASEAHSLQAGTDAWKGFGR